MKNKYTIDYFNIIDKINFNHNPINFNFNPINFNPINFDVLNLIQCEMKKNFIF